MHEVVKIGQGFHGKNVEHQAKVVYVVEVNSRREEKRKETFSLL
jgi:hypothetical protein